MRVRESEGRRRCRCFQPANARSHTPHPSSFISPQLAGLGAALYKLHTMGLLPTHAADYAAQLAPARAAEFVGGGSGVLGGA